MRVNLILFFFFFSLIFILLLYFFIIIHKISSKSYYNTWVRFFYKPNLFVYIYIYIYIYMSKFFLTYYIYMFLYIKQMDYIEEHMCTKRFWIEGSDQFGLVDF